MSKYGFCDGTELPAVKLSKPKRKKPKSEPEVVAKISQASEELDFKRRSVGQNKTSDRQPRKPGPKPTELQDKLTISGPKRIFDEFRDYCDEQELQALWQGLEVLLETRKKQT